MRELLLLGLLMTSVPAVEFTTATFPDGHKVTGVYRKESNTLVMYRDGAVSSVNLSGPDGTPIPTAPAAQEEIPYPALQGITFTTITLVGGQRYTGILDAAGKALAIYGKNGSGLFPLHWGLGPAQAASAPTHDAEWNLHIVNQGPADPLDIPYQAYLEALARKPPGSPGLQSHVSPSPRGTGQQAPSPAQPAATGASGS